MDCRASALHFGNVECQMSNVGPILTDVCVIDIVSLEGNSGGLVTLYATPRARNTAETLLQSHLEGVRSVTEE